MDKQLTRSASTRQPTARRSSVLAESFRRLGPLFFILFCVSLAFNILLTQTTRKHVGSHLSWKSGVNGDFPTTAISPEGTACAWRCGQLPSCAAVESQPPHAAPRCPLSCTSSFLSGALRRIALYLTVFHRVGLHRITLQHTELQRLD